MKQCPASSCQALRQVIRDTFTLSWGVAGALSLLYWLAGEWIIWALTDLSTVRHASLKYLQWVVLLPVVAVASFVYDGLCVATLHTRVMRNSMLIATVSVSSPQLAFAAYALPAVVGAFQVGPCFAIIQSRTPSDKRAVAAAINLFIGNIIGLGLGPLYVGLASDALHDRFGDDSLGWALGSLTLIYVAGAALFLAAARRLDREWTA